MQTHQCFDVIWNSGLLSYLLATTYFSDPKVVPPGMVVIAVGSIVIPLNRTGISPMRFCKKKFFFLQIFGFFLETNFRLTEVAKIIQGISVHASPDFPSDNISQCISKPGHWQWHDTIS